MLLTMDMGTSNTRLFLCEGDRVVATARAPFGAKLSKTESKDRLYARLGELISSLLVGEGIAPENVECIMTSGMAGSEMGIAEIPHAPLPADVYTLADGLTALSVPKITPIPFVLVPGLAAMRGGRITDMMRGEETETAGILSALPEARDCLLVLPGTHNKLISIDGEGRITDFLTTMSGELLDGIVRGSVLSGSVSHDFTPSEAEVLLGARYAEEKSLSAALFHIRVMAKNGKDTAALSSFLYGAVLGGDIAPIRRMAAGRRILIGGRESLSRIYALLLGEDAEPLDSTLTAEATRRGLCELYALKKAREKRAEVLAAVEREKLIAIVRLPEEETLLPAMEALYAGGVRLAEITFDRSGKVPREETAGRIAALRAHFGDRMHVGAGTVTSVDEVMLAYRAGAEFIISPTCQPEIIRMTRRLGLVSIPAAMTPTEVVLAMDSGADFVKLFPADSLAPGFIKAVSAPIADAKFLAVGGVTADNVGEFLSRGFVGVGVGSGIYAKGLIESGDYAGLTALAERYTRALKQ